MHPILWSRGPVTLHAYGVLIAIAVFVAARGASRRAHEIGATPGRLLDLCVEIILGGIAGARLLYVLQNWPQYAAHPVEIVRLDHGGLVFYGGFLGGVVTALLAVRRMRLPLWPTFDLLIPYVALAQAIGRIGCFLNGCCYGAPTQVPWCVRFPYEAVCRHPTQLYESAALFLLYGALRRRARRPAAPGTILAWYLIGYGGWRFLVEFVRGDNPLFMGPLTFSQVVSVPLVAAGAWLLWRRRAR